MFEKCSFLKNILVVFYKEVYFMISFKLFVVWLVSKVTEHENKKAIDRQLYECL